MRKYLEPIKFNCLQVQPSQFWLCWRVWTAAWTRGCTCCSTPTWPTLWRSSSCARVDRRRWDESPPEAAAIHPTLIVAGAARATGCTTPCCPRVRCAGRSANRARCAASPPPPPWSWSPPPEAIRASSCDVWPPPGGSIYYLPPPPAFGSEAARGRCEETGFSKIFASNTQCRFFVRSLWRKTTLEFLRRVK